MATDKLAQGQYNTTLLKNNSGFSHNGPWRLVGDKTVIDRWHVGEISSVEYTISVDYDTGNKEIIKALCTATIDNAKLVVFSRVSTGTSLVELSAVVNESYVDVLITPTQTKLESSKFIFTASYFHNQNTLVPQL